jgi:cell wall-associated NlpC family hydrolase
VGTPYIWGGEAPGVGFDCSGLVQAAYKAAGISLPRVAQDQFDATAKLGPGNPLQPGDLVFFGGGPTDVTHVGIYIGNGQMVDAPHTGADVRVEAAPTTPGVRWGSDIVVGFTRPIQ